MKKTIYLLITFLLWSSINVNAQETNQIWGTTLSGGSDHHGVIFSTNSTGDNFQKRYDFTVTSDGTFPEAGLTYLNGKLYGATQRGGVNNSGVIYEWNLSNNSYSKMIDLSETSGHGFYADLVLNDGKFYGVTNEGGSAGNGTLFEWDPLTNVFTKKVDFGFYTYDPVSLVSYNGKLYGVTAFGGDEDNNGGVLFEWDPISNTYTKLVTLRDDDFSPGGRRFQSLVLNNGKLYGTTSEGGKYGAGVIFEYDPANNLYTKKVDLPNINGSYIGGPSLTLYNNKFYGTEFTGGDNNAGFIYEWDPVTNIFVKRYDFDFANGKWPRSKLLVSNEKFYGTTTFGGAFDMGILFEWDPVTNNFNKKKDFDGTNGSYPDAGNNLTLVQNGSPNTPPTVTITCPAEDSTYKTEKSIVLSANASDADGTIKMVQFYNSNQLIGTESNAPYYRRWYNVAPGNYTITAKATDNDGNVIVSAPVHITVVHNLPPVVSITGPVNGSNYSAPATVIISANASDPDGTIKKVEFYSGTTLLHTENYSRYLWYWKDVAAGTYTITAKAIDDNGKATVSAPVTITVSSQQMARGTSSGNQLSLNNTVPDLYKESLGLKLNPNPAKDVLNISTEGFKPDSKSAISIISLSGSLIKTIQTNALSKNLQMNVSYLKPGSYFIKVINGDKVMYKQFIKL